MPRRTLNLGILAHVDAGKTTLTERLLQATGAIEHAGSVDAGTTQTDSLELERRRGITIRSAVVSFRIGGVSVNVIDTPGHPDFIAEVERVLGVLDGAVLVLSAVEGVQPQTRVLMRALARLRVPTLLFVNKVDRPGAGYDRVLAAIASRLGVVTVPMGSVDRLGTPAARVTPYAMADSGFRAGLIEALTGQDDALLTAYVEDEAGLTATRLRAELAAQTGRALVHPVYFGSAVTGAGVDPLMAGMVELLPAAVGDPDGPVSGTVFKIERGPAGERIAYARMFSGTVRARDSLPIGRDAAEKVTAVSVFDSGAGLRRGPVRAGEIGKLWGLGRVRVGDWLGRPRGSAAPASFPPPAWETVVVPGHPADQGALRAALAQLAEQDPLINVRDGDTPRQLTVSLYGEVQKEVIQATLASEFGVDAAFRETTTVCVERPAGTGEAVALLHAETNPFNATIGLRVEPAPAGSGFEFRMDVEARAAPLYAYKSLGSFADSMARYVRDALREGPYGWQVTDCVVTMVECVYSSPDGPPATRGPRSTAADFRKLTPLVVARALERSGTVVCEPILWVGLEIPSGSAGPVLAALARLGGAVERQAMGGELSMIETLLPAARVAELQLRLPELTGGEGVLDSRFSGYRPVRGDPPTRRPRPFGS